jgi:hypothetical protein
MPNNWWVDRGKMIHMHNWVVFHHKEEWHYAICIKMDGTGDHHVVWDRSRSEKWLALVFWPTRVLFRRDRADWRGWKWASSGTCLPGKDPFGLCSFLAHPQAPPSLFRPLLSITLPPYLCGFPSFISCPKDSPLHTQNTSLAPCQALKWAQLSVPYSCTNLSLAKKP